MKAEIEIKNCPNCTHLEKSAWDEPCWSCRLINKRTEDMYMSNFRPKEEAKS
ncbi:MAG TPA: hypothetical protein O0X39_01155 [Methanocorpusculum sp.]|nr:hypothetical protein [Methanocorpusculum sp.]